MLILDGRIALKCFVLIVLVFTLLFLLPYNLNTLVKYKYNVFINPLIFYALVNVILLCIYNNLCYQVAVRASFLGQIFVLGVYVFKIAIPSIHCFGLYMSVMSFFHYSEYITIAIIKPKELNAKSFMLSHSPAYIIAAIASWVEFIIESYFFPVLKSIIYISYVGLAICICGEIIRKLAMFTANKNFDHLVQHTKADDHSLVTHGIYSLCRHPSYVGWFYWSIGTQIILANPICIIAYALTSWKFFNERIKYEEVTLLNFFGQQYYLYQEKVPTGLPFIKGYIIKP